MRLQHQRIDSQRDLPRRLGGNLVADRVSSPSNLREFLLAKSDTKDEVNESKQMLFNKHVGEGNQNARSNRFAARNRFFRKDVSDDCLSSNYPNSSRSTVRDMTCSSISSAMASISANNDDFESSWKETDMDASIYQSSIAPSESFEYDDKLDRLRISQMDERWNRPQANWRLQDSARKWQHVSLDDFVEEDIRNDTFEPIYNNMQPYHSGLQTVPTVAATAATVATDPTTSYSSMHLVAKGDDSNTHPQKIFLQKSTSSTAPVQVATEPIYERQRRIIFEPVRSSCSHSSSVLSRISGYTMEHLRKARRFGSVVPAIRKPGHHVGPAKNPDCQCDHCRRWFADRESGRERALSVGDVPYLRNTFWAERQPDFT